ncbi:PilT/PilU family type 4a pilus ATPase [Piscinibacter sakaiensis]|uniref:Twitching motility protein PilT n=1 Tax=Piscinibacter sakaiensis TaxID=1547922 RepID=A0A0K8NZ71_PISS1|nr:PilT/PilU family type 4a pilus ATPase [Piscinibacter sakaiensis]GAP35609.1 twitching motility protein PilT [Piscinibacter sakaiensis]
MDTLELLPLLEQLVALQGSDLFLTVGAPPHVKVRGVSRPLPLPPLRSGEPKLLAYSVMTDKQVQTFESQLECNLGIGAGGLGRFRINVYQQRGETALVARYIREQLADFSELGLPPAVAELASLRRGLVLVVGAAGSGKSTSLAAMVDYRARSESGHILTVEDPIEFLFHHRLATVDQREVGIDTWSFAEALRNAMRQAPDMIMIGEIRDRETMQQALTYADTGHLCLSTLHANNANQAIKRILNFFPETAHAQLLMDLSLNLQGVVSQRLIKTRDGSLVLATETMLHSAYIADLILKGAIDELKPAIAKSVEVGMHTFDQSLFDLYRTGRIDQETALRHADSRTDLGLRMKLELPRGPDRAP